MNLAYPAMSGHLTAGMIRAAIGRRTLCRGWSRVKIMRGLSELPMSKQKRRGSADTLLYIGSVGLISFGMAYASVPLYRILCSQTGIDGTPKTTASGEFFDPSTMEPVRGHRKIKVTFDCSVSNKLGWEFIPSQRYVMVIPGETTLAFYNARNKGTRSITGMSTYSVAPAKAAQYFNKIQCFCFEDQKLLPGEDVDMPVFFYIDPEFARDPRMSDVSDIVLHYTFFKSKNQI